VLSCSNSSGGTPDRIARLALLGTTARADTPEQSEQRRTQIAVARSGRFTEILNSLDARFPILVHCDRGNDEALRRIFRLMAEDTGAEAFVRQQTAMLTRPDSRPGTHGDPLPDASSGRGRGPGHAARTWPPRSPAPSQARGSSPFRAAATSQPSNGLRKLRARSSSGWRRDENRDWRAQFFSSQATWPRSRQIQCEPDGRFKGSELRRRQRGQILFEDASWHCRDRIGIRHARAWYPVHRPERHLNWNTAYCLCQWNHCHGGAQPIRLIS